MYRAGLTIEEGNKLFPRTLGAKGKSNCRQPMDSIQAEQNIIVLQESQSRRRKKHSGDARDRLTLSSSMSTAMG